MNYRGKHQRPFDFNIPLLSGGLNTALPVNAIPDNCAAEELNMWLSPTGQHETRPGFTKLTTAGLGASCQGLYYSSQLSTFFGVAGHDLYSVDASTGAVTLIGSLNGTNDHTGFCDFNGKVHIAHGGVGQDYDGTTLASWTSSGTNPVPSDVSYVKAASSRIWALGDEKAYWCGAEDPTDWGGGVGKTGGYAFIEKGDGSKLSGFSIVDGNPVIFKGNGDRQTITLGYDDPTTQFAFKVISEGTSCQSGALDNVGGDVMFCAKDGVQTLSMVRDFSNPRAFPRSLAINPTYLTYSPVAAAYDPKRGMFFVFTTGDVFVYHVGTQGWHRWKLPFTVKAACYGPGDKVYVGDSNGHVYYLSEGSYADNGAAYQSYLATKAFDFGVPARDKHFSWLTAAFVPLGTGDLTVYYRSGFGLTDLTSSPVSLSSADIAGWDGSFAWDAAGIGWDMKSYLELRRRINVNASNMQMKIVSLAPFRVVNLTVQGAVLGRSRVNRY